MNIHEHQAKKILKNYGAKVPNGIFASDVNDLLEKAKTLDTEKYVLKAQIHSGGRGKAGGIKLVNNLEELEKEAKNLIGKILVTHQTGSNGKNIIIKNFEKLSLNENNYLFHAGTEKKNNKIYADGGRVLNFISLSNTYREAKKNKQEKYEYETIKQPESKKKSPDSYPSPFRFNN